MTAAELPPEWRIEYEERAAIMEYDGGLPRYKAEGAALRIILQEMQRAKQVGPASGR